MSELPRIPEKMYAYTPLFNDAKNVVTIVGFVRGLIDREQTAGADDHRFTVQPSYLLDSRPHLQHATYRIPTTLILQTEDMPHGGSYIDGREVELANGRFRGLINRIPANDLQAVRGLTKYLEVPKSSLWLTLAGQAEGNQERGASQLPPQDRPPRQVEQPVASR